MPDPQFQPRSPAWHRWLPALGPLAKVGLAAIALSFAWRLIAGLRWADLAARLALASRPLVALALFFLGLRFALWDRRYRLAAGRALGRRPPSALFGFPVLLASAALNLLNPAARLLGGPLRARSFARAARRSFGLFYGVVLYDQLVHQAVTTVLTCLAVLLAALARGHLALGLSGLAALAAALSGAALWSRRRGPFAEHPWVRALARQAERAEGRLQRVYAQGHEAAGIFVRLLADSGLARRAFALGLALFLANAVAQWLIFRALGQDIGMLPVVAVVALGNAAGMLGGTPGGIGTTEAAMVAAYGAFGVDRASAGAATLLFRGLYYALVLAVGLPALAWLEAQKAPRATLSREESAEG
jgi:uncharacterized membrane protein YbhN (UPF0104 family)